MKQFKSNTASSVIRQKGVSSFFENSGVGLNLQEKPSFFSGAGKAIQTKLTIGQPNDKYEQEADHIADKVVRRLSQNGSCSDGSNKNTIQTKLEKNISRLPSLSVQMKCAECEHEEKLHKKGKDDTDTPKEKIQKKPIFESDGEPPDDIQQVQQKCEACGYDEMMQKKQIQSSPKTDSSNMESSLASSKGSGNPLPDTTRQQMESSFDSDFGNVKIHDNGSAVQMNRDLQAQAFTHSSDIYFNSGKYNVHTKGGQHLLAHELTHVIQQTKGKGNLIQLKDSCPQSRERGEIVNSMSPQGILVDNTIYRPAEEKLYIQDFPINSKVLPPDVVGTAPWQRAMSMIIGDPATLVVVTGYTDCNGSVKENLSLRKQRADSVITMMPVEIQNKIFLSGAFSTTDYLASNDTAEDRAKNRAVTITFRSVRTPRGVDSCDILTKASNLDEYMFLVRCVEKRLGLTLASDAPKTLSVLRQLYYGNESWANSQNKVWDDVITDRPWSPGNNPEKALGSKLFNALKASQVLQDNNVSKISIDIGHLLTGLDSMRNSAAVEVSLGRLKLVTSVFNDAWATWAGDVGSAAAEYVVDVTFLNLNGSFNDFFTQYAGDSDLEGDIDGFAIWAAFNASIMTGNQVFQNLKLNAPLSEILMNYYRLTSTQTGQNRNARMRVFVQSYGGIVNNGTITNRTQFENNLYPQIQEFAMLYFGKKMTDIYKSAQPSSSQSGTGAPSRTISLVSLLSEVLVAANEMTKRFVDWLIKRL